MNHWLKIVSIVELDPQATLYVNYKITHIIRKHYSLWCQVSV